MDNTKYSTGLHASDEVMKNYVNFICSQIPKKCGASIKSSNGIQMKGCHVPLGLSTSTNPSHFRILTIEITLLNFTESFLFYMSRVKSPSEILSTIQDKINETAEYIINENNMDRDAIWQKFYYPRINIPDLSTREKIKNAIESRIEAWWFVFSHNVDGNIRIYYCESYRLEFNVEDCEVSIYLDDKEVFFKSDISGYYLLLHLENFLRINLTR